MSHLLTGWMACAGLPFADTVASSLWRCVPALWRFLLDNEGLPDASMYVGPEV